MTASEMPANEAARLAARRALDILDTASEERFDRVARSGPPWEFPQR